MMAWFLDTLVWSGALIALVLAVRRPVARMFGAGIAYALWLLPLLRLVLPPLVLPRLARAAPPGPATCGTRRRRRKSSPSAVTAPAAPTSALPWDLLLSATWLGGAALFLIARVVEYRDMRARLLDGAVVVDGREGVRIVETPAVDAPVAFGVRDKVIAVPPRFLISGSLVERDLALRTRACPSPRPRPARQHSRAGRACAALVQPARLGGVERDAPRSGGSLRCPRDGRARPADPRCLRTGDRRTLQPARDCLRALRSLRRWPVRCSATNR